MAPRGTGKGSNPTVLTRDAPLHTFTDRGEKDMIERGEAGTFDVECDSCGDVETFVDVDGDWRQLMEEMKEAGWTKEKVGDGKDDWEHYCPICSESDYAEDDFDDDDDDEDEDDDLW